MFSGRVVAIQDIHFGEYREGCTKIISLQNEAGAQVNFILTPSTYVVNQAMIKIGDMVTGYYDAHAPAVMIYPPQYIALVMVKEGMRDYVKVSYFNRDLMSQDGQLILHIQPSTKVITTNGQIFSHSLNDRDLIVIYSHSTKSIPAQTTPKEVIVLC